MKVFWLPPVMLVLIYGFIFSSAQASNGDKSSCPKSLGSTDAFFEDEAVVDELVNFYLYYELNNSAPSSAIGNSVLNSSLLRIKKSEIEAKFGETKAREIFEKVQTRLSRKEETLSTLDGEKGFPAKTKSLETVKILNFKPRLVHDLYETQTTRSIVTMGAYSPDGKVVATVSHSGGAVHVWEAVSGNFLFSLKGRATSPMFVSFSRDAKRILTTFSEVVRSWESDSGRLEFEIHGDRSQVAFRSARFSMDDKYIAVGNKDNVTQIYDGITGNYLLSLKAAPLKRRSQKEISDVTGVMFSPVDSNKLLTSSRDGVVRVWDLKTSRVLFQENLGAPSAGYGSAVYSPDGKLIVTTFTKKFPTVIDASTGQFLFYLEYGAANASGKSVAFSPDGKLVVLGNSFGEVLVWRADHGKFLFKFKANENVQRISQAQILSIAFTADSRFLLTTTSGGEAKKWDLYDTPTLTDLTVTDSTVEDD